ncbi:MULTISPECIES: 2-keto-4-pentenoate hydratase [unclassified Rhizobium]|uniref:2-keto-4-pentenoate hydratase n=1 Tax=unclassified Rhizobium TaxID=2613769 RepID=UPI002889356A|nr:MULTISPECIES: 2-keto-4-pentenoate hydratase [unclassified Rhizobium]
MTIMTGANIRLGAILAEAEKQQSFLSAAKLEANGLVPETIETGMAAQAISAAAIGKEVGGWKVSFSGGRAVAAPLIDVHDSRTGTVPKKGAVGVEIEICFVLSSDIPAPVEGRAYERDDILAQIASVHLGAELVSYRLIEENNAPFPLFLADRLGNHSFVLGPEIDRSLIERVLHEDQTLPSLRLEADGAVLLDAPAKHPQGDAVAPLLAYANSPIDHLGGLTQGQVVTTGSLCGLIRLSGQTTIKASWGEIAALNLSLQH